MRKVPVEVTTTIKSANPEFDPSEPKSKSNPEFVEELVGTSRDVEFPDTLDEYIETKGESGTYKLAFDADFAAEQEKLRGELKEAVNPDAAKKRSKARMIQL